MNKTKEGAEETRRELLKAGLQVFSERGYSDTRMNDIVRAAGLSRGALYYHFGSKEAIFHELMADAERRGSRIVDDAVKEGGTAVEILRRIFVSTLCHVFRDENAKALFQLLRKHGDGIDSKSQERARQRQEELLNAIEQGLREGQREGSVRTSLDVRAAAVAFLALQSGTLDLWLGQAGNLDLEHDADELATIYIRGIT